MKIHSTQNLRKGPIWALTPNYAGTFSIPAHVCNSYSNLGVAYLTLNGVEYMNTGFETEGSFGYGYLYYGSQDGFIGKIEVDPTTGLPYYPTMGKSIGTIHQSNPLDFPQEDDESSTYSLLFKLSLFLASLRRYFKPNI